MADFLGQSNGVFSGWESPPTVRVSYNYDTLTEIDKCQLSLSKCEMEAIAKLVWNYSINNNTAESRLVNTENESKKARQFQSNAAIISQDGKYVEIYDDDGVTILHRFNVSDDRLSRFPL